MAFIHVMEACHLLSKSRKGLKYQKDVLFPRISATGRTFVTDFLGAEVVGRPKRLVLNYEKRRKRKRCDAFRTRSHCR